MAVLPLELMTMIADHVHGEKKAKETLIVCSLVDTHWHVAFKPYVFHSILLQMKTDTFSPSIDFFQANPRLALLVRNLYLYRNDDWDGDSELIMQSHIFLHLLDVLPAVDVWRFSKIIFEEPPPAINYCAPFVRRPIRKLQLFSPYVCEAGSASSMGSLEDPPEENIEAIHYILDLLRPFSVIGQLTFNNIFFGPKNPFDLTGFVLQHELAIYTLEFHNCKRTNNFIDILQNTETSQVLGSVTYTLPRNRAGALSSLTTLLSSAISSFKFLRLTCPFRSHSDLPSRSPESISESLANISLRFLTHLDIVMPPIWLGARHSHAPMLYNVAWLYFERLLEIFPTTSIARIDMSFTVIRWNNTHSSSLSSESEDHPSIITGILRQAQWGKIHERVNEMSNLTEIHVDVQFDLVSGIKSDEIEMELAGIKEAFMEKFAPMRSKDVVVDISVMVKHHRPQSITGFDEE
ncbi:hypothetical protein C8Q75DRAFT_802814 [Abortiporus biennis]|nr:hypothetical protein C8Q75DRAFT_802814 [Abortiporus biennis]